MINVRKRRTQAERTAISDQAMFKAAIKLIARDGPSATTLAKIGREAGFSAGLVSYRFQSKSKLLVATAERILELWETRVISPAGADQLSIGSLRRFVELYFEAVSAKSDLIQAQYRLLHVSYNSYQELRPAFREFDRQGRARIVSAINAAKVAGKLSKHVDADQFAVLLVGTLRGIAVQYFLDEKSIDINAAREATLDMMEKMLIKA